MNLTWKLKAHLNLLAVSLLAAVLTACGGGGGGGSSASSADPEQATDVSVSGSVGDGPIVGATISIYSASGKLIKTLASDNTAKYTVRLKVSNSAYPLTMVATGGTDIVTGRAPDFKLESVIQSKYALQVNLNPYTTLMTNIARQQSGGLQASNLSAAQAVVMSRMNFGLITSLVSDPMTTTITKNNIAAIVKASETLGEMIRRTRDAMSQAGTPVTADYVIGALASDLSDGLLDGKGVAGTDRHVSALANVIAGQVNIEAMSNNLHVYGAPATAALDAAILAVRSGTPTSLLTGSINSNAEIIVQARSGVAAANAIAPSDSLAAIAASLSTIIAGSTPQDVGAVLPADRSADLASAISAGISASDQSINLINSTANAPFNGSITNTPPTISGTPSTVIVAGSAYSFTPSASDVDGDALTFNITNKPSWATFSASTGSLTGVPSSTDVGTTSGIVITVSDGTVSTSLPGFSVTVNALTAVNHAPVVSNTPATAVNAGSAYSYTPAATDADNDPLTFSITNKPTWATFSTSTGALTGTPTNSNAGTTSNIVITVSDGKTTTAVGPFSITVTSVNHAPVVSNTPATAVSAGSAYSYTPAATDADGDPLTFSITNKPTWATFTASTGKLSGTPTNTNAGTTSNIVISVSDGKTTTAVGPFSITVTAVNHAPTISGTPATTVVEGALYGFTPVASDADGNALTFSITNKPSWATFNTATGTLSGTPTSVNVGTSATIVISVSDGTVSTALPGFTIKVNAAQPTTFSAALSWNAPATRTDGSALSMSQIGGYVVKYGTASGNYTTQINIPSAYTMQYTVQNLPAGTYYFVVTAYDTNGLSSGYSSSVAKVLQ